MIAWCNSPNTHICLLTILKLDNCNCLRTGHRRGTTGAPRLAPDLRGDLRDGYATQRQPTPEGACRPASTPHAPWDFTSSREGRSVKCLLPKSTSTGSCQSNGLQILSHLLLRPACSGYVQKEKAPSNLMPPFKFHQQNPV